MSILVRGNTKWFPVLIGVCLFGLVVIVGWARWGTTGGPRGGQNPLQCSECGFPLQLPEPPREPLTHQFAWILVGIAGVVVAVLLAHYVSRLIRRSSEGRE